MKRDLELVRQILLHTEDAEERYDPACLACEAWPASVVLYHVELMKAHGLIDATVVKNGVGVPVRAVVSGLTWDGCDYLDAIRDEMVWEKTKRVVKDSVGSTTLGVIKQAAVMVATNAIKVQLGLN